MFSECVALKNFLNWGPYRILFFPISTGSPTVEIAPLQLTTLFLRWNPYKTKCAWPCSTLA